MLHDRIGRFRRFARAVTKEVGALDTSFLGRGRPLGAARVLNAIGVGRTEVAEIRDDLGLNSGLMSRLLRGLEEEGLVSTTPHPDDARRRVANLTEAGRREFRAYEEISNARALALLERAPRSDELLDAMDLIASALGRDRIAIEEADPRGEAARSCLGEYYAELGRRFEKEFDVSRSRDPDAADMVRPRGAFLLAMSDGMPIGCVGLKGAGGELAEIEEAVDLPDGARPRRRQTPDARRGDGGARTVGGNLAPRHQQRIARGAEALPNLRLGRDRPVQRRPVSRPLFREASVTFRRRRSGAIRPSRTALSSEGRLPGAPTSAPCARRRRAG